MQQLIDIYSSLSRLSHNITPQNSILFIGFVIMLLPTIVTLIVFGDSDRPQSGRVKEILGEICGAISIITLIGSPIIMCCIYNPVNQGIEAPTYLKEQITKVEQSNQKRQIYTNDDNIELTFIYKNMKYKPSIHDTGTYHIGEHYYKDEAVSVTFDKLPSDMDVPVDVFRYSVFPIQKSFKDFDPNQLDNTVYGYLTGTKNQARQTTYAMLQKKTSTSSKPRVQRNIQNTHHSKYQKSKRRMELPRLLKTENQNKSKLKTCTSHYGNSSVMKTELTWKLIKRQKMTKTPSINSSTRKEPRWKIIPIKPIKNE